MIRAYCVQCKTLRMCEPDIAESEKECRKTAKDPCEKCNCPYVEEEEDENE